jgi:hypothetical protein
MNRRIKSASNLSELAAQEAEEASSSRSVRFQLNGSSLAVAIDDDSSEDDDDEGGEGMLQESASWNPPPSSTQEIADSHFDLSSSFFKRRQGFGRNAETNWCARYASLGYSKSIACSRVHLLNYARILSFLCSSLFLLHINLYYVTC